MIQTLSKPAAAALGLAALAGLLAASPAEAAGRLAPAAVTETLIPVQYYYGGPPRYYAPPPPPPGYYYRRHYRRPPPVYYAPPPPPPRYYAPPGVGLYYRY